MPATTTEIGLRAAKTLVMRALDLRDSIQLVTWLHGLPITRERLPGLDTGLPPSDRHPHPGGM